MNFDQSDNELSIREGIRSVLKDDAEGRLSGAASLDPAACRAMILNYSKMLKPSGYLELGVKSGRNSTTLAAAREETARFSPGIYLSLEVSTRIFGRILARLSGNLECSRILESLMAGESLGTVALSESTTSYDQNPPSTTAVQSGSEFLITGSKEWVAHASFADWIACLADMGGKAGIFIVSANDKGLEIGKRHDTMAFGETPFYPVSFRDCEVPAERVLFQQGEHSISDTLKLWEDQILTALALGIMQRSYNEALAFAKTHSSAGKPIIAHQEVGFKLAEMLTLLQTAQLLAYRAAWMDETDQREAEIVARCAKVFSSEASEKIAAEALQILGARGFFQECASAEDFKVSKYLQVSGTSSERSRVRIGDGVLRQ